MEITDNNVIVVQDLNELDRVKDTLKEELHRGNIFAVDLNSLSPHDRLLATQALDLHYQQTMMFGSRRSTRIDTPSIQNALDNIYELPIFRGAELPKIDGVDLMEMTRKFFGQLINEPNKPLGHPSSWEWNQRLVQWGGPGYLKVFVNSSGNTEVHPVHLFPVYFYVMDDYGNLVEVLFHYPLPSHVDDYGNRYDV